MKRGYTPSENKDKEKVDEDEESKKTSGNDDEEDNGEAEDTDEAEDDGDEYDDDEGEEFNELTLLELMKDFERESVNQQFFAQNDQFLPEDNEEEDGGSMQTTTSTQPEVKLCNYCEQPCGAVTCCPQCNIFKCAHLFVQCSICNTSICHTCAVKESTAFGWRACCSKDHGAVDTMRIRVARIKEEFAKDRSAFPPVASISNSNGEGSSTSAAVKCTSDNTFRFGVVTWNINKMSHVRMVNRGIPKRVLPRKDADDEVKFDPELRTMRKLKAIDRFFKNPSVDIVSLQEVTKKGRILLRYYSRKKECPWKILNMGPSLKTKGNYFDSYPILVRKPPKPEKQAAKKRKTKKPVPFTAEDEVETMFADDVVFRHENPDLADEEGLTENDILVYRTERETYEKVLVPKTGAAPLKDVPEGSNPLERKEQDAKKYVGNRPFLVYTLNKGTHKVKIAAVHTSPSGSEFSRQKIFKEQVGPVLEKIARLAKADPTTHWVILGDWYLSPEAVVESPTYPYDQSQERLEQIRNLQLEKHSANISFAKKVPAFGRDSVDEPSPLRFALPVSGSHATSSFYDTGTETKGKKQKKKRDILPQQADFHLCSSGLQSALAGLLDPVTGEFRPFDQNARILKKYRQKDLGSKKYLLSDHAGILAVFSTKENDPKIFDAVGYDGDTLQKMAQSLRIMNALREDEMSYLEARLKDEKIQETFVCMTNRLAYLAERKAETTKFDIYNFLGYLPTWYGVPDSDIEPPTPLFDISTSPPDFIPSSTSMPFNPVPVQSPPQNFSFAPIPFNASSIFSNNQVSGLQPAPLQTQGPPSVDPFSVPIRFTTSQTGPYNPFAPTGFDFGTFDLGNTANKPAQGKNNTDSDDDAMLG